MRAKDDVQKLELTHWDQMVHDGTKKFVYSEMFSKNVVVFICVYISVQFHFKVTVRNLISLMKLLFNQLIIGMHEKRNIYIYIIVSLVSCVGKFSTCTGNSADRSCILFFFISRFKISLWRFCERQRCCRIYAPHGCRTIISVKTIA